MCWKVISAKPMRSLASAVSIVSTAHDDRRFGMTATAVCSLSMQPPTLLVCVNQSTSLHHPLLSAGRFCINILHADQDELARTFGRKVWTGIPQMTPELR